jgi:hypothetical protein
MPIRITSLKLNRRPHAGEPIAMCRLETSGHRVLHCPIHLRDGRISVPSIGALWPELADLLTEALAQADRKPAP